MALTKTTKQSYEKYFVYGDFSAVMATGETITSAVITAQDSAGTDVTSTIIEPATDYSDTHKHYVRIQDGVEANGPYKFTIRIETSAGNKWEIDGSIVIKET